MARNKKSSRPVRLPPGAAPPSPPHPTRPTVLPTPPPQPQGSQALNPTANAEVIQNAATYADRVLGSRTISNGTRLAATVLQEQAEWGRSEVTNGPLASGQRAVRFIQCAYTSLESHLELKEANDRLAASRAEAIKQRNELQRELYKQKRVSLINGYGDYIGRLLRAMRNRVKTGIYKQQVSPEIAEAGLLHTDFTARNRVDHLTVNLTTKYKQARDVVFKAVFRTWNTNSRVYPPNPTRDRYLGDTTVQIGWLAEDAPAPGAKKTPQKRKSDGTPTKQNPKRMAGAEVLVKVVADFPISQLTFPMVDRNGSVFPNSINITYIPNYNLPRLRTEETMKWDDTELKRFGTTNMEWVVYWTRNRLRRSFTTGTHGRHEAVHSTFRGKKNFALTAQCFTSPIPEQEDILRLVDINLCVDLLHGQYWHAQEAIRQSSAHHYMGIMGIV